jgi:hypothetical protein
MTAQAGVPSPQFQSLILNEMKRIEDLRNNISKQQEVTVLSKDK